MKPTRKRSPPLIGRLHINRNQLLARAEVAYEVGITSIEHGQKCDTQGSETTFWAQIEVIDGKRIS